MEDLVSQEERLAEVWQRLSEVTDPELDEPVTELGFVERVEVDDDNVVEVDFRLPTYWCAANFAFLMGDDIRIAVEGAPWCRNVRPRLLDHMYEDEVNRAAGGGRPFKEVFDDFGADETLDDVRKKFRLKAFQRRQELVLRALRRQGFDDASLIDMTVGTLEGLSIEDQEGARQKPRYLRILSDFGLAHDPDDPAFITALGDRIPEDAFETYLQELRGVRINMEFNGAICRGLLSTRYKEAKLEEGREPTLVDFIHGRVPPRGDTSTTA
ncbi:MAG: iron-sulfur cluster assembly protein [Geminicoccaceae bacterium]